MRLAITALVGVIVGAGIFYGGSTYAGYNGRQAATEVPDEQSLLIDVWVYGASVADVNRYLTSGWHVKDVYRRTERVADYTYDHQVYHLTRPNKGESIALLPTRTPLPPAPTYAPLPTIDVVAAARQQQAEREAKAALAAAGDLAQMMIILLDGPSNAVLKRQAENSLLKSEAEAKRNSSAQGKKLLELLPRARAAIDSGDKAELAGIAADLKRVR